MDYSQYKNFKEFDNHDLIVRIDEPSVGLKGFIAIHKKSYDFPALGATRLWNYASEEDALNDALRLAKLMGNKSAMAGLPYTGAKAVLMSPEGGIKNREEFFKVYAQKVNELAGQFVTGTDVGLTDDDLHVMRSNSPFIIGSGVPAAYFTALGVLSAIKASLEHKFGTGEISGRTFAIQGLGKTGYELLKLLYAKGAEIFVSDLNQLVLEKALKEFPLIRVVQPDEIHKQEVDVFCPCAMSHTISSKTINELRCAIIAGSANNQLEGIFMGEKLHELGIIYVPDYIANGGGLISVVDQFENKQWNHERVLLKLNNISEMLSLVLLRSEKDSSPINIVSDIMAREFLDRKNMKANV